MTNNHTRTAREALLKHLLKAQETYSEDDVDTYQARIAKSLRETGKISAPDTKQLWQNPAKRDAYVEALAYYAGLFTIETQTQNSLADLNIESFAAHSREPLKAQKLEFLIMRGTADAKATLFVSPPHEPFDVSSSDRVFGLSLQISDTRPSGTTQDTTPELSTRFDVLRLQLWHENTLLFRGKPMGGECHDDVSLPLDLQLHEKARHAPGSFKASLESPFSKSRP